MIDKEGILVSIIVPVYNVEKYVKKCLASLVNQTYKNIEIIVVNDGSTDCSRAICDKFYQLDSRIKMVDKINGGLSDARNAGIEVCNGEYIFFLDSDDYISEETIERMLEVAIENDADIVECDAVYVFESDTYLFEKNVGKARIFNHDEALFFCLNYDFRIMVWNKLYKKELIVNKMFPKGKYHEDEYTTPYIVDKVQKYCKIDNVFYAYVVRENSIMTQSFSDKRLDIIEAFELRMEFFNQKYNNKYKTLMLYHYYVRLINLLINMGKEHYRYNEVYKRKNEVYDEIIKSSIPFNKKIKAVLYGLFPKTMIQLQQRRERKK